MPETYTIPDFGPSDLMTTDIIGARRLKSQSTVSNSNGDEAEVISKEPGRDASGIVVRPILPATAFGELPVAEYTPIVQSIAPYGITQKMTSFVLNNGTTSATNGNYEANSGTNPNALSALLTTRQIAYRAGQGVVGRGTMLFDTPQPNSKQQAGLITATDRLTFGYIDTDFGIIYEHGGKTEIRELQITTAATGAENASITIDDVVYSVPITAGTVQHNAYEIAEYLNTQTDEFTFASNDDTVVSRALLSGAKGSYTFSSSTALGTWSTIQVGVDNTVDFIAQADWNIDAKPDMIKPNGNVFQIKAQYLGYGAFFFEIEDKKTGIYELVHIIQNANSLQTPTLTNPTFRSGILVQNTGNTINIQVRAASVAGFIEGQSVRSEQPRSLDNTNTATTGSFTNILTVRNRIVFGTLRNRAETFPLRVDASADTSKNAIIRISIDADFDGDMNFQYIDKDNSTTEFANDAVTVTNGRSVASFVTGPTGKNIDLQEFLTLLQPGQTLTVAAEIVSGADAPVTATYIGQEDF